MNRDRDAIHPDNAPRFVHQPDPADDMLMRALFHPKAEARQAAGRSLAVYIGLKLLHAAMTDPAFSEAITRALATPPRPRSRPRPEPSP